MATLLACAEVHTSNFDQIYFNTLSGDIDVLTKNAGTTKVQWGAGQWNTAPKNASLSPQQYLYYQLANSNSFGATCYIKGTVSPSLVMFCDGCLTSDNDHQTPAFDTATMDWAGMINYLGYNELYQNNGQRISVQATAGTSLNIATCKVGSITNNNGHLDCAHSTNFQVTYKGVQYTLTGSTLAIEIPQGDFDFNNEFMKNFTLDQNNTITTITFTTRGSAHVTCKSEAFPNPALENVAFYAKDNSQITLERHAFDNAGSKNSINQRINVGYIGNLITTSNSGRHKGLEAYDYGNGKWAKINPIVIQQ